MRRDEAMELIIGSKENLDFMRGRVDIDAMDENTVDIILLCYFEIVYGPTP